MTSITFSDFRCHDTMPAFSLEEAWRKYASWSNLHDFSFRTLLASASEALASSASVWTDNTLIATLPASFTVQYHKTSLAHATRVKLGDGSEVHVYIGTDASGYPTVWNHTGFVIQQVPLVAPMEGDCTLEIRQQTRDATGTILWFSASLYINNRLVLTYARTLQATYGVNTFGLATYDNVTQTLTSLSIPELGENAEIGSLDFDETPFGGLSRTIEGRYLIFFLRFDGSLRVQRQKARDTVVTFSESVEAFQENVDLTQLITHARMTGAYIWGEAISSTLIEEYEHRYGGLNNPMLLTEEECDEEASRSLKRSEESAFGASFSAQHNPLLEPEDRITVDGRDWVINDYSLEVGLGFTLCTYNLRRYVWAEET